MPEKTWSSSFWQSFSGFLAGMSVNCVFFLQSGGGEYLSFMSNSDYF